MCAIARIIGIYSLLCYLVCSDFEWLLQSLSSRYIGLLLPSLPEKKVMKNDGNMIRSRMRSLNIFVNQLTLGTRLLWPI